MGRSPKHAHGCATKTKWITEGLVKFLRSGFWQIIVKEQVFQRRIDEKDFKWHCKKATVFHNFGKVVCS